MDDRKFIYYLIGTTCSGLLTIRFLNQAQRKKREYQMFESSCIWSLEDLARATLEQNTNPRAPELRITQKIQSFENIAVRGLLRSEQPIYSILDPKDRTKLLYLEYIINPIQVGNEIRHHNTRTKYTYLAKEFSLAGTNSQHKIEIDNLKEKDLKKFSSITHFVKKFGMVSGSMIFAKSIFPFRLNGFDIGVSEKEVAVKLNTQVFAFGKLRVDRKRDKLSFEVLNGLFNTERDLRNFARSELSSANTFMFIFGLITGVLAVLSIKRFLKGYFWVRRNRRNRM